MKKSGSLVCMAGAAALLLLAANASANGFRNPPAGAAALSLDGAKSTLVEDPSSISHNPANLAEATKPSVMVTANLVAGRVKRTNPLGASATTENGGALLPDIYMVWPLQEGKFVFGLGMNTPYGQNIEWNEIVSFPYYSSLAVVNVNPTIAAKLGDSILVGVGADLYLSTLENRVSAFPLGRLSMTGSGAAVGANAGVTWKMTDRQRLALTCRSAFDIDYEGDTEIASYGMPLPPPLQEKSDFETTIKYPNVVTLGYGIRVSQNVRVGADVEWLDFSRNDRMTLDLGINTLLIGPGAIVLNDWEDIWTAGVAGAWKVGENVELRASYRYLPTPIPDDTYAPSYPDNDRHIVAAGIGLKQGPHSLDMAVAHNFIDKREIEIGLGNPNSPPGSYEYASLIGSAAYRFEF